jgi:hypothetical protein
VRRGNDPSLADIHRVPEKRFPLLDEHEAHARAYVLSAIEEGNLRDTGEC